MRALVLFALVVCCASLASAQATKVDVDIRLPNYDVIYVSDLVDVSSGSISNAIPNVSFVLTTSPPGSSARVFLKIVALIQLKGDVVPSNLVTAETFPFDLNGSLIIASRDLARSSSGAVRVNPATLRKNSTLETRLKDHILNFPTAPVGTYTLQVEVFNALGGNRIGFQTQTVEVKNTSAAEVSITLVEPLDGATLATVLPTFSWTTEKPTARLKVYEKLPQYQSPQDAVTGIPHLDVEVRGSSFTYPPTARKLEPGKSYYWFIESVVSTNRGDQTKQSEIRMFRILLTDASVVLQMLERLFSTYGGDLASTLSSMQNMGLQLTGEMTRDGVRITREELARLFDQFLRTNTQLQVRIE
jgi:hypothetical protein